MAETKTTKPAEQANATTPPKAVLYAVHKHCALSLSPGDLADRSAFAPKTSGLDAANVEAQTDANIARLLALGVISEAE